jgi:hypothetical protein
MQARLPLQASLSLQVSLMAKEKLSGTRRGIGAADFLQTAAHSLRYP